MTGFFWLFPCRTNGLVISSVRTIRPGNSWRVICTRYFFCCLFRCTRAQSSQSSQRPSMHQPLISTHQSCEYCSASWIGSAIHNIIEANIFSSDVWETWCHCLYSPRVLALCCRTTFQFDQLSTRKSPWNVTMVLRRAVSLLPRECWIDFPLCPRVSSLTRAYAGEISEEK